jgi:hypothetical protein
MIQQGIFQVKKGCSLQWVRIKASDPQALVFIPPLVGGTVGQQAKAFRHLVRKGMDLFTFNYSGHCGSTGHFSLRTSLRDVYGMLYEVRQISQQEKLPLFGIASCYAAIPFLNAIDRLCEPVRRLVLVNAIPRLSPFAVIQSFCSYYNRLFLSRGMLPGMRAVFKQYADMLFPGIPKSRDCFGVLRRRRARLGKIVSEFFTLDPLRDVYLARTPALCLNASDDSVLDIYTSDSWSSYRKDIMRICPETEFQVLPGDHFFSGQDVREKVIRLISSFFNASS